MNIKPNMKVAYEVYDPKDLLSYMLVPRATWEWLRRGARDYMELVKYVSNRLLAGLQLAMGKK